MEAVTKGQITRARVIRETTTLIHEKGFKGTSISDIIKATGVKKGNLYFHFPNKEAIGIAFLEEVKAESATFVDDSLHGQTPMQKIANYLDAVFIRHKSMNFVGGCMIGNSALEMGDNNPLFASKIADIFGNWKSAIAEVLSQAKAAGELKIEMEAEILANHMVAVIEGGIMMAKVTKDENDLKNSLYSLRSILALSN